MTTRSEERVAVTGLAISCSLGTDTETVWRAIREGRRGIRLLRRFDVPTLSCRYSGEMDEVPIPARRPRGRLDRASRLALAVADEAVGAAGLDIAALDPYRIGVALGTSVGGLDEGERFHREFLDGGAPAARRHHLLVYPLYTAADAVSAAFGLRGPKAVISNACAAGANSIGYAVDMIREDRADAMLAGGVDVLDILSMAGFSSLDALDPEPCAPYSRSTGLNLGEGAAMLMLEAESAARARGATIICYLQGYTLTSDAHHATAPEPGGSGALRAMRGTLAQAGLAPDAVDYINGHGTGTPANDSAERKAIDTLVGAASRTPVSSTKSQVGHMLGAAGAIEAAVCALALRDQVLPPTINVADPAAQRRDIVPNRARPAAADVVLSNSFAFGGNNCSLLLTRRPYDVPRRPDRRVVLTGAGVVSPIGLGRSGFQDALRAGATGIAPARSIDTGGCGSKLVAEITDTGYRAYVDRSYARRLDQLGLLVLSASRMALDDAGLKITRANSERAGMVFGTYTGPLETVGALTRTIQTSGPHKVSPRLFPNSVMNAAAGHACLSLQLKGPLSTLATGTASGALGLGYAVDLVRRGAAEVMLAVAADELTSLLHLGYDRLGLLSNNGPRPYDMARDGCVLGAGSVALIVESLEHALERGATILAEVTGQAVTSDAYRIAGNEPSGVAWAESFRRALADAGLAADEVCAIYGDARGVRVLDRAEARAIAAVWPGGGVRVADLSGQVGHVHSVTPLLSAVAALETCATGWVPRVYALSDPVPEFAGHPGYFAGAADPPGPCVISAANWGGTYATVIVGPYR
ncbi:MULTISPECIES: beta-ketoacyl synthase [unclassified Nocardia]|uniref:beta-ketoacyl-[acyl-carrier-protein] synthase family protein n=1 Tax=unclassified Nocardia TaxID=2637762 RepID=UPI001CE3F350|nr:MULTISPECIES: beta-ketoacyl-[acyl-carrier-protein] synthase family protein [unclassified Nocardia]